MQFPWPLRAIYSITDRSNRVEKKNPLSLDWFHESPMKKRLTVPLSFDTATLWLKGVKLEIKLLSSAFFGPPGLDGDHLFKIYGYKENRH